MIANHWACLQKYSGAYFVIYLLCIATFLTFSIRLFSKEFNSYLKKKKKTAWLESYAHCFILYMARKGGWWDTIIDLIVPNNKDMVPIYL